MSNNATRMLDKLFPSSRPVNLLYALPQKYSLPSGEAFSHVVISNSYFPDGEKLIRLCCLTFSVGTEKTDRCRYGLNASYEDGAENGITTISESNFELTAKGFERTSDSTESKGAESWKFGSKFEILERILGLLKELTPTEISSHHPLLNPVNIKSARFRPGEDDKGRAI